MTIEEILGKMQSILDENKAKPEVADDAPLSDDQASRYETLEKELKSVQKSEEIQKRNAAYNSVKTSAVLQTATNTQKDETLERAFDHYLRTGKENSDLVQLRAQGEATGSEGGFMVPEGFRTKLVDRMKAFGGIANVAEVITTATGNSLPWPTIDDTANVGEIVAEGGTFASGADLVFGTESLGAYKYMAGGGSNLPLRVSVELLQDAAFDVESLVAKKLGERIARIQSTHLVKGPGSSQPLGLIYGKTGVEIAVNTGVTYDDLITFIHSVDPAYRENAKWAFNDASLATVQKLKDSNGDSIWRPLTADMGFGLGGGTLLGYPVVIDQAFDSMSNSSNTVNWGAFGDLQEGYVVRRVRDLVLVVNPWTRAANGQVEFTAWARMDATVQNANSYVALTGQA
jgi:HK97 family phage major capsid protein